MGKDNQQKARQARDLARKKAQRGSYDRILIVCEGSKTEPQYFNEIRSFYKIHTANVEVQHSQLGTQPLQVVEYAEQLFTDGNIARGIQRRAFEHVYAVFDRDDHATYREALAKAETLNAKLRNDLDAKVVFKAVPSVPCFELWLLLHFEDVLASIHRDEVYARLRRHLPGYDKGQRGYFQQTREKILEATLRANRLCAQTTSEDGREPYTDLHTLVRLLTTLRPD
jgi:hypothetical protein